MLVPFNRICAAPARTEGYVSYRLLSDTLFETIPCPGASRSGFAKPSYHVGPRELYGATLSSARETVSAPRSAPTVIADGALPGEVMPAYPVAPATRL